MTINALTIARKLKESGFTPQQAEAQAELWTDIVESDLASKRDIKEIDLKISQVEANIKRDIKDTEVKIAQVESNLRRDIKELELKMASGQTTLEKGQSDTQKQMLQIGIGLALFIIAGVSFVLRLFGHP